MGVIRGVMCLIAELGANIAGDVEQEEESTSGVSSNDSALRALPSSGEPHVDDRDLSNQLIKLEEENRR